jgi:hypothetical protein
MRQVTLALSLFSLSCFIPSAYSLEPSLERVLILRTETRFFLGNDALLQ